MLSGNFKQQLIQAKQSEDGAMTVFSVFCFITALMVGGLAVDVTNVMMERTRLQVAADAGAHAALLARDKMTESAAKTEGVRVANLNMPKTLYGDILTTSEISFGNWNPANASFTAVAGSRNAVLVQPKRNPATQNAVATYVLKIVGFNEWSLKVDSIFTTYRPTCLREGFVAEGVVDLQSNNSYSNGFCIHSNTYVSLNSNNYFAPGTVVSMPDTSDIQLPNSGYKTNTGLSSALRSGSFYIRIVPRIIEIIAGLNANESRYVPGYITSNLVVTLDPKQAITQAMLVPGRMHNMTCANSNAANVSNGVTFQNIVLRTNCVIKFGQGVILQNTVIATSSTDAKSLNAASGLQVGTNDNCAVGGGAQLVTMGGMAFPSDLKVYGGQLLAKGDIQFAANANGIQGASFVAGGIISGTSNMSMGFCGTGMENNFEAEYFKMTY